MTLAVAAPAQLDHLSHSQVTTFTSCPRKWYYDKIARADKERTGSALVFGTALHDTLAAVNEAAMDGEDLDRAAFFRLCWGDQLDQANGEIVYGRDDADALLAKGLALAAAYRVPGQVVGVEEPIEVHLTEDLPPVVGRIDLIYQGSAGDLVLADLKTASAKTLSDTAAVEDQLGLYRLAVPAAQHEAIVLAKTKAATVTRQPVTPRGEAALVGQYRDVHRAMEAGVRFRVRSWQCGSCPFRDRCRRDAHEGGEAV